jgi:hypothetical protein
MSIDSSKYIPVEDYPDLVRDRQTGALLYINTSEIDKQKQARAKKIQERQEIDQMKSDINEIKLLLQKLVEK